MRTKYWKKIATFITCLSLTVGGLQMSSPTPVQAAPATFSGTHFGEGFDANNTDAFEIANGWSNGGFFNCTWRPENVTFTDGKMGLTINNDSDGEGYSGGEYRTKDTFGYGMYSVNMKPIKNPGVVTSFFTYTGPTDGTEWHEIDIEFLGYDTTKVQFNYFTNGVGEHEYLYDLGFDASQEFHTYGFYWAEDSITWYVDDQPVYTATVDIPSVPGKIMVNAWPGTGVDDWLQAYNGATPLTGYYDWIAYDAPGTSGGTDSDANTGTDENPGTGTNPGAGTGAGSGSGTTGSTLTGTFTGDHVGVGFESNDTSAHEIADGWSNGGFFNCTWRPENVSFSNDGIMSLKIDHDIDGEGYSGGEYRTTDTYGYGMYSVNMKPIKNPGVVSSFFTYTGPTDGTEWHEIDIEFLGYDTTKVQFNYFTNGVGEHEYLYDLGFDASEEFHTYGFYWAEDSITWYVDNVAVYTATVDIPYVPGKIMMNAWPGTGVDSWLQAYNGATPLTAYYDWFAYDAPTGDSGSGEGTGSGSGTGSGEETGNGSGTGSGEGTGSGTGTGSGEGTGSGSNSVTAPAERMEFKEGVLYSILSRNSGKALDVENGDLANGTNILQYTYNGTTNQKWYIEKQTNGYYIIKNEATGKVVTVEEFSTENGGNVHQWEYVGNTNQEWEIAYVDGYYTLKNRNSGLMLDVSDVSVEDNANIQQWEANGQTNQMWTITELKAPCTHANKVTRDSKEATCAQNGYTGDIWCADCNVLLTSGTATDKLTVHTWNGGEITTAPTPATDGVRTYTCDVCGTTKTEAVPAHCDHTSSVKRNEKEATCKEAGYTGDTYCALCDEQLGTGEEIAKLTVHTWDEGQVTTVATPTTDGVRTYTCTVCGETKTAAIPANCTHTETTVRDRKEATCQEAGYTGNTYCTLCDTKLADGEAIPQLTSHSWDDGVVTKPVTATENGEITYTCTICGEENKIAVEANCSHVDTTVKNQKAPTCTEEGYTGDTYCVVCAKKLELGSTIEKLSEHTWDNGKVTVEATATSNGVKTYTCTVCGITKTEVIAATGNTESGTANPGSGTTNPGSGATSPESGATDVSTVEAMTQALTANKTENDIAGSEYAALSLRVTKSTKKSNKLKWNKVDGANGYIVLANKCGSPLEVVKTIENGKTTSYTHKGLKKSTYYKYVVVAYKVVDGKQVTISTSKLIHVPTTGGKYSDIKSIKVNKAKVTLKKGKTFKIKAKEVKKISSKKISRHRKICYESTDVKVATVSKNGKIKAAAKGTCYVYAYAQNGVSKRIKVTVR